MTKTKKLTKKQQDQEALFNYALLAVKSEAKHPYHGRGAYYDSQAAMIDVLNHFDWLTNSDDDLERVTDAVHYAESELLCRHCQTELRGTDPDMCDDCAEADRRSWEGE